MVRYTSPFSGITTAGVQLSKSGRFDNTLDVVESGLDADTLDGKHAGDFVETSDDINADTVDGEDASAFVTNRYQDSEARNAVSGSSIDGSNFTGIGGKSNAEIREQALVMDLIGGI